MSQIARVERYTQLAKAESIAIIRQKVAELKKELCKIQGIVDSDDLKMCVDALTGKPVLILREEAQKQFEALFYYVQALRAVNEIELILGSLEAECPRLTTSQA